MVKVKVNRVAGIFSDSLQEEVDTFLDLGLDCGHPGFIQDFVSSFRKGLTIRVWFKPGRVIIPGNWACEHSVFIVQQEELKGEKSGI